MRLIDIIISSKIGIVTSELGHPINKYCERDSTGIRASYLFQNLTAPLKKKKKIWHNIITYSSFHRFSLPQGRGEAGSWPRDRAAFFKNLFNATSAATCKNGSDVCFTLWHIS